MKTLYDDCIDSPDPMEGDSDNWDEEDML